MVSWIREKRRGISFRALVGIVLTVVLASFASPFPDLDAGVDTETIDSTCSLTRPNNPGTENTCQTTQNATGAVFPMMARPFVTSERARSWMLNTDSRIFWRASMSWELVVCPLAVMYFSKACATRARPATPLGARREASRGGRERNKAEFTKALSARLGLVGCSSRYRYDRQGSLIVRRCEGGRWDGKF